MKTRLFLTFFLFSSPFVMETSAGAKPQHKVVRRTVVDYFRLLPMEAGIFEAEKRESLIGKGVPHLIDRQNDYIQVTGDGAQPSFQIAVFRHRGRDLVAVSSDSRVGDYGFSLWRYERRSWKKVTSALSPLTPEDSNLHFVLPRYGTTIKVFRRGGTLAARLYWENGRFGAESFDSKGRRINGP